MNKYFNNISTLEELRKQYKELLKLYYPDNGGNVSEMQEINAEYDKLFKIRFTSGYTFKTSISIICHSIAKHQIKCLFYMFE